MAKNKKVSRVLITPMFRMSFPELVSPKQFQNKGAFKFQTQAIFPNDSVDKFTQKDDDTGEYTKVNLKDVLAEICDEYWDDTVKGVFGDSPKDWPMKNGDKKAAELEKKGKNGDAYKDTFFLNLNSVSLYPPALYYQSEGERKRIELSYDDDDNVKIVNDENAKLAKKIFVGGFYAYAEINLTASVVSGSNYITPYMNMVLFARKGDKLGGGPDASNFDGVAGGVSDFDPTEGMGKKVSDTVADDDDVPF